MGGNKDKLKMYDDLAAWWPLISAPADYAEEAEVYRGLLQSACSPRSVLELGSGGGNNALHMKTHFDLTLVDRSNAMLAVSRALNPECEHVQGDMRDVRLEREFDAVFIQDAIMYLTSERDLARAIETAFVHCRPGGAALLVPDCVKETFVADTGTGGHDGEDRSLRYIEWRHDADPSDGRCEIDYALLLKQADDVQVVHERHVLGLFSRSEWLAICRGAGFEPEIKSYALSEPEGTREAFLCRKASDAA
jgi:SAM-dependent methyltransferase